MTEIIILDCTGLESPEPMIKTKSMLDRLDTGDLLKITVDNEGSIRNIRTLITSQAYQLVSFQQQGQSATLLIKK